MNKTIGIVQARFGSSRLPGKVLKELYQQQSLLQFLLQRLRLSQELDMVVLATTEKEDDDKVALCGLSLDIPVVRGSEDDVLARYAQTLEQYPSESFVRITADNPLTDPGELDALVLYARKGGYDYVIERSLPIGISVDYFSADAFRKCVEHATTDYQKEHINAYILDNSSEFQIGEYEPEPNRIRRELRLTIDTPEDFDRVRAVVHQLGSRESTIDEIIHATDSLFPEGTG